MAGTICDLFFFLKLRSRDFDLRSTLNVAWLLYEAKYRARHFDAFAYDNAELVTPGCGLLTLNSASVQYSAVRIGNTFVKFKSVRSSIIADSSDSAVVPRVLDL